MRKIVNMVQMSEEEFKAWHESKKEIKKLKGYLDDAQKVGARLMTENVILASEVEGLRSENQVLKTDIEDLENRQLGDKNEKLSKCLIDANEHISNLNSKIEKLKVSNEAFKKRFDADNEIIRDAKKSNEELLMEIRRLKADYDGLKNQLKLSDKKYSETIRELICENDKIRSDSDSVADSMLEMSVENEKLKATISNMEEVNNILRKNLEDILTENERICRNKCCKDQEDEIKKLKHLIASEDAHIDFSSEASTGVTVIIIK